MTTVTPPQLPTHEALDHPIAARVIDVRADGEDVVTLFVHPIEGPLPVFEPAQFSMIGVVGVGEVPISISTPVSESRVHGYTIRRNGAVTNALVGLERGDVVTVRGPFGRPWDLRAAEGRDVVFVAGGIGIAPLRAAIHSVLDGADRFGGVSVLIGAIAPSRLVYGSWLDEIETSVGVHRIVDRVPNDERWAYRVGLVTELLDDAVTRPETEVFVCGPDPMMRAAVSAAGALGVTSDHVQLTLERNMDCGVGWCGHCQLGGLLVCRDGPVVRASELGSSLGIEEW